MIDSRPPACNPPPYYSVLAGIARPSLFGLGQAYILFVLETLPTETASRLPCFDSTRFPRDDDRFFSLLCDGHVQSPQPPPLGLVSVPISPCLDPPRRSLRDCLSPSSSTHRRDKSATFATTSPPYRIQVTARRLLSRRGRKRVAPPAPSRPPHQEGSACHIRTESTVAGRYPPLWIGDTRAR